MISSINELIVFFKQNQTSLKSDFGINHLSVFGSFSKNNVKNNSDIDLLINVNPDYKKYFLYLKLKTYLSDKTGREIDLVYDNSINPIVKKHIKEEIKNVW